jgi:hypothetical protein
MENTMSWKRLLRKRIKQYKKALQFLDECGAITEEKITQAYSIAGGMDYQDFKREIATFGGDGKEMAMEYLFKDHENPEQAYLEWRLESVREKFTKQIAEDEDKLRSIGGDLYKSWWQFWK